MEKTCKDWLRASSRVCNARQMYRLAEDVMISGTASARQKREARRVVKILSEVIDKPIAEDALLKAARRRFDGLVAVLGEGQTRAQPPFYDTTGNPHRQACDKTGRRACQRV